MTLCIAIGALLGGCLGDQYGRRSVFIVTMAMIVFGAAMLALMTSFPGLLIGAILVGLGTGADLPVSLAAIAEAAADENRGKLLGFSQIMWTLGILGALGCSTIVGNMGRLGGQILFGQVGAIASITLILRIGIPESDKWKASYARQFAGAMIQAKQASIKDLLKAPFLAPFIALLIFYPLTNLGANTGGQFNVYLWRFVIGKSVQFSSTIALISFPIGLFWAYWFMRIADTPKRFTYFQIGAIASLLSYFIPAIFGFSTLTMIVAYQFAGFGGAFAFEAIMKLWTQESFPTLLRTTAQGAIISVARVLAAALATVTPMIIESRPRTLYFMLGGICFAGLVAAWLVFRKGITNAFAVEGKIEEEAHISQIAIN